MLCKKISEEMEESEGYTYINQQMTKPTFYDVNAV